MRDVHEPVRSHDAPHHECGGRPERRGVTARSYVDAIVLGPDNQTGARSAGYYDDELVPTDDGWKIARRRFTMVLLQSVPERQALERDR